VAEVANQQHLDLLQQGVESWNQWRKEHPKQRPNLRGADLRGANLRRANLFRADLRGADLRRANLREAVLTGADLGRAQLYRANLNRATLTDVNLEAADLERVFLRRADLRGANLREANLQLSVLVASKLDGVHLTGARVYGISAWGLEGVPKAQSDLIITPPEMPAITVDNLKVAQFIYLLLDNEEIRDVIDTITSKVVLILGRFTDERKTVLDAIRKELRRQNLTPILFDFDKPASKDLTGTVETLARLARFIIADLTDPSSIPHELGTVVPLLRTTPVLPLRLQGSSGYSMFDDLRAYPWVLKTHEYQNVESLVASLAEVIEPAETKAQQFRRKLTNGGTDSEITSEAD